MVLDQQQLLPNLKILIVDDNKDVRIILSEMLKIYTRGEITFANDGMEAVSVFENTPDIDLIFMDVYMPGMDGYETTRKIRKLNKDVIIFVMTASVLSELIGEFAGIFVNDYFPKPFNTVYLKQLIWKYFKPNDET